jgi:hypothetical protein
VTNLGTDTRAVVRFYNTRGTTEHGIIEGKQAVKMTRLSCHRFRSNQVRLWLSVIADNLENLWHPSESAINWKFDRKAARRKFGYKNHSFRRSKT